jgi:hypothetical protein
MISNIVLGTFAFLFFILTRKHDKFWSLFFLFIGLSAFTGAVYHYDITAGETSRFFSWGLLSVALLFALFATYNHVDNKLLKIFFIFKSLVFLSLAIGNADFIFMAGDTFISLMVFIVIGHFLYLHNVSPFKITGIIISVSSALIFVNQIVLHKDYLNANDLGHYITVISLFFIMTGVREDARAERLTAVFEKRDNNS